MTNIYRGRFEPVPPEKQLVLFLWYSANQDSQREIAVLFDVGEWYVNTAVKNMAAVHVLTSILKCQIMTEKMKLAVHVKVCVAFRIWLEPWMELI